MCKYVKFLSIPLFLVMCCGAQAHGETRKIYSKSRSAIREHRDLRPRALDLKGALAPKNPSAKQVQTPDTKKNIAIDVEKKPLFSLTPQQLELFASLSAQYKAIIEAKEMENQELHQAIEEVKSLAARPQQQKVKETGLISFVPSFLRKKWIYVNTVKLALAFAMFHMISREGKVGRYLKKMAKFSTLLHMFKDFGGLMIGASDQGIQGGATQDMMGML